MKSYNLNNILAEYLINNDIIEYDKLSLLKKDNNRNNKCLSELLLDYKLISPLQLYKVLSDRKKIIKIANNDKELIKLLEEIDYKLLNKFNFSKLINKKYFPISKENNIIKILVADFKDFDIDKELKEKYGDILIEKKEISIKYINFFIDYAYKECIYEKYLTPKKNKNENKKPLIFTKDQVITAALIMILLITCIFYYFNNTFIGLSIIINIIFIINVLILFKDKKLELKTLNNLENRYNNNLDDNQLPMYSIIIPILDNEKNFNNIILSLKKMNYPKDKMDVIVLIKDETLIKFNNYSIPDNWSLILIPDDFSYTRSKMINYCLSLIEGDYFTFYNFNDLPEQDQLKKAIFTFENYSENIYCLKPFKKSAEKNKFKSIINNFLNIDYNLDQIYFQSSSHYKTKIIKDFDGFFTDKADKRLKNFIKLKRNTFICKTFSSKTFTSVKKSFKDTIKSIIYTVKNELIKISLSNRDYLKSIKKYGLINYIKIIMSVIRNILIDFLVFVLIIILLTSFFILNIEDDFIFNIIFWTSIINLAILLLMKVYFEVIYSSKSKVIDIIKTILYMPFCVIIKTIITWKALFELLFKPNQVTDLNINDFDNELMFLHIKFKEYNY